LPAARAAGRLGPTTTPAPRAWRRRGRPACLWGRPASPAPGTWPRAGRSAGPAGAAWAVPAGPERAGRPPGERSPIREGQFAWRTPFLWSLVLGPWSFDFRFALFGPRH